jgi:hypothetical protein
MQTVKKQIFVKFYCEIMKSIWKILLARSFRSISISITRLKLYSRLTSSVLLHVYYLMIQNERKTPMFNIWISLKEYNRNGKLIHLFFFFLFTIVRLFRIARLSNGKYTTWKQRKRIKSRFVCYMFVTTVCAEIINHLMNDICQ